MDLEKGGCPYILYTFVAFYQYVCLLVFEEWLGLLYGFFFKQYILFDDWNFQILGDFLKKIRQNLFEKIYSILKDLYT